MALYGEGLIYTEDEIIEVDVTSDNDIIYYIYNDSEIASRNFVWYLYGRDNLSSNFSIISDGTITSGYLSINLNDYGLQFEDKQYLLRVVMEGNNSIVANVTFWYYYRIYIKSPKKTPWYSGAFAGGGGMGAAPIYKEKPLPVIKIKKFKDEEKNIDDINIRVSRITELELL